MIFFVSNPKEKCFTPIGIELSVNLTAIQCEPTFMSSQFSISEVYIAPRPWKLSSFINKVCASLKVSLTIKIQLVSFFKFELKSKPFAINLKIYL